jgi:Putative adhesin
MSSLWENETHGEEPGRQLAGPSGRRLPASEPLTERGTRGGLAGRSWRLPLIFGLLMLVVGAVLAWLLYGDRAGGTSVYQDSVDSGAKPMVRITNGPGRVQIEGTEGETVEITAKRYARGFGPTSAKENAASIPVDIARDGSTVNISSNGGRGTNVDYDLKVPRGSTVEVESAVGDVEVSGLSNTVTVRAEGGDVSVKNVRGSVNIEAPRGDVAVESMSTETGRADITVGFGDLQLKDLVVGILEAQVEAGDADLSGRFSGGGKVFVGTGSINSRLPSGDTKDLDLEAYAGEVTRDDKR